MSDNRIFSGDACTVCGRLGDPHAEWCDETRLWLRDTPETGRLSDEQVRDVRQRALMGETHTSIAACVGVSRTHITHIVNGKRREHVV